MPTARTFDAGIHRLELRRQVVVDVIDHVLVAGGDDVERLSVTGAAGKATGKCERGGE